MSLIFNDMFRNIKIKVDNLDVNTLKHRHNVNKPFHWIVFP